MNKNIFNNKLIKILCAFISVLIICGGVIGTCYSQTEVHQNLQIDNNLQATINGKFIRVGDLKAGRSHHKAILLNDGKVLIVGGTNPDGDSGNFKTCELYDPKTHKFSKTGDLNVMRYVYHTLTLLKDGRVLVVGGAGNNLQAEIYDPKTGKFTLTGSTNYKLQSHTTTLLQDGTVLVVGQQAEIYDPITGKFSFIEKNNSLGSTATLLPNGKVIFISGSPKRPNKGRVPILGILTQVDEFDPATGSFTNIGNINIARFCHTATLLPNNKIFIVGGNGQVYNVERQTSALDNAEMYDLTTNKSQFTGNLNVPRVNHNATLLPNGKILITDGTKFAYRPHREKAEIYDPVTNKFYLTQSTLLKKEGSQATLLRDGSVLITGGYHYARYMKEVELFEY